MGRARRKWPWTLTLRLIATCGTECWTSVPNFTKIELDRNHNNSHEGTNRPTNKTWSQYPSPGKGNNRVCYSTYWFTLYRTTHEEQSLCSLPGHMLPPFPRVRRTCSPLMTSELLSANRGRRTSWPSVRRRVSVLDRSPRPADNNTHETISPNVTCIRVGHGSIFWISP